MATEENQISRMSVTCIDFHFKNHQVGCMRQALGPGALGRPGGSGWRGMWEGGSGWGRHVNSRPFHFNV